MADDYQTVEVTVDPEKWETLRQCVVALGAEMLYHVPLGNDLHIYGIVTRDSEPHALRGNTAAWEAFQAAFLEGTDDDE